MTVRLQAPGLDASIASCEFESLADNVSDLIDDTELKGGILTLAIHDAAVSGVPLQVHVQVWLDTAEDMADAHLFAETVERLKKGPPPPGVCRCTGIPLDEWDGYLCPACKKLEEQWAEEDAKAWGWL